MIDLTSPFPFGLNRRNWPFFAAGLVVVLALLVFADHPLSVLVTQHEKDAVDLANKITRWGESDWILIPSGVMLIVALLFAWLLRTRIYKLACIEISEIVGLIFVGVGLPGLATGILKRLVGRSRPVVFDEAGVLGFHPVFNHFGFESWPSGHTTTAFALCMVLGFLSPRWFWVGLLYAFAVAGSRLALGVHYPTDVLSGCAMGVLGAYAVRYYFASRRWGFEQLPDGRIVQRPMLAIVRATERVQRKLRR
jgi:membrane-associated phospholipid phosphatase